MRRFTDWAFRDRRTGALTIGQFPNPALAAFGIASVLSWIVPQRSAEFRIAAAASLAIWAADELLRGVNPWRRCLGAAVLVYLAATALT